MINNIITITELSTLTNKSRPTLYKYFSLYENDIKNEIPNAIVKLFDLLSKDTVTKKEIIDFCQKTFQSTNEDMEIQEIINLIKDNKDKIDLKLLKKAIKEGIKNG